MIVVCQLRHGEDLDLVAGEINAAQWDDTNDICEYDAESLRCYLLRQDAVFIACYWRESSAQTLLGIASARIESKPYERERWLYVDEVDVCSDQRQRGAGKAMMRKLIEIARQRGCIEVWLGTEADNAAANALYRSLQPDEISPVIGYTYSLRPPPEP